MRYNLVTHGGKRLGDVLLADGVSPQDAGRELISGRPMRLVPEQEAEPTHVGSVAGAEPTRRVPAK